MIRLRGIGILLSLLSLPLLAAEEPHQRHLTTECVASGSWLSPAEKTSVDEATVLARAVDSRVVLLGEHHDNQLHHDWQLAMLRKLHQRNASLALGFEMLPRDTQPLIDRYLDGEIGLEVFLEQLDWDRYWSFSADYYTPLLAYARKHQIPVKALNVTRDKVDAAVETGWAGVPAGLTLPAQATRPYLRHLVMSFQRHKLPGAALDMAVEGPAFRRFVQKQLLWDRAMAEGIGQLLAQPAPPSMVVAFIGSGHLMHGYGVPHQLQSLAVEQVMTLIPWDRHLDCSVLQKGFADAVYGAE